MTDAVDLYGPPAWCEVCQREVAPPRVVTTETGRRLLEARIADMRASGAHLHDPLYVIREPGGHG